jgi:hypothetical protein
MTGHRPLSRKAQLVKAHVDQLHAEDTLTTFEEVAVAILGGVTSARAVGAINRALTDRNAGDRYPGTDLVLNKDGTVAGTYTLEQAVQMLRDRGFTVVKRGDAYYVDR